MNGNYSGPGVTQTEEKMEKWREAERERLRQSEAGEMERRRNHE